jgi:hypothetical protein
MGRAYQIFGEAMVLVRFAFGVPYPDGTDPEFIGPNVWELGLTQDPITVTPNFYYKDINIDSFGPNVPADVLSQIADVTIEFNLVHYDPDAIAYYQRESLAGGGAGFEDTDTQGKVTYAGEPLGGGIPLYEAGNAFVGLEFSNLSLDSSPVTFPATYLVDPPVKYKIGTKRTIFECKARALPYAPLTLQSGSYTSYSNTSSNPIITNFNYYTIPINGNILVTSTDLEDL